MKTFTDQEIADHLAQNFKNWRYDGKAIQREFKFKTFAEAFSFMKAVALEAEKTDHHPDWSNSYNKVSIALATHSEKGITQKDFDLAAKIDTLFENYKG